MYELSLLSGTILPVLVFEVVSMWKYSLVIQIVSIIVGVIAIALGIIWASKKVSPIKRINLKREALIIKAARASRIICCLLLIGVCIYGKSLIATHFAVNYSDIAYSLSEPYNDIPDYENSLPANISTVAKIDPDGGWGSLSIDEKTAVLETAVRIECRYLGMLISIKASERLRFNLLSNTARNTVPIRLLAIVSRKTGTQENFMRKWAEGSLIRT